MRVAVAGSNDVTEYKHVDRAIKESGFEPSTVVVGGIRTVERLAEQWATRRGVPIKGFRRNKGKRGYEMEYDLHQRVCQFADALVVIWDGIDERVGRLLAVAADHRLQVHGELLGEGEGRYSTMIEVLRRNPEMTRAQFIRRFGCDNHAPDKVVVLSGLEFAKTELLTHGEMVECASKGKVARHVPRDSWVRMKQQKEATNGEA